MWSDRNPAGTTTAASSEACGLLVANEIADVRPEPRILRPSAAALIDRRRGKRETVDARRRAAISRAVASYCS